MSMPIPLPMTCPACGHEQPFTAWRSLNVTLDPGRKAELLDGSLTRFTCGECGHAADVAYPMLYHDMQKQLMVWLLPPNPEGAAGEATEPEGLPPEWGTTLGAGYTFRRVASRNELVDKVYVFDHGLDDRVVECVKVILLTQMPAENRPPGTRLFFDGVARDDDGARLAFAVVTTTAVTGLTVPCEPLYGGAATLAAGDVVPEGWPVVDQEYALAMVDRAPDPPGTAGGGPAVPAEGLGPPCDRGGRASPAGG